MCVWGGGVGGGWGGVERVSLCVYGRGVYGDFVCENFLSGGSCNEGSDQGGISFRGIFALFSPGLPMRFPEICQRN